MSFLQRIMSVEKLAWSWMCAYNVNLYTFVMVENFGKIYAKDKCRYNLILRNLPQN